MCSNFNQILKVLGLSLTLAFACSVHSAQQLQTINLDITTTLGDTPVYYEGDQIQFLLSLDRDAHVVVLYLDADNNLIQIMPNVNSQKHRYQAGAFLPVPDSRSGFTFRVEPPFGTDQVWAFASDQPVNLTGTTLKNGLILINGNIEQIRRLIKSQAGELFDESSKTLQTRPSVN